LASRGSEDERDGSIESGGRRRERVDRARRATREAASAVRERARRASGRASEATAGASARARDMAREMARRARERSVARVRSLGHQARAAVPPPLEPHLCFVQSPRRPIPPLAMSESVRVATYNVHRWQGANGRARPDIARAGYVISELDADVIALQEVLRPFPGATATAGRAGDPTGLLGPDGEDPLGRLCEELDLHLAFAVTRQHRHGQLGNAILSRYPITAISVLDISFSRIERRGALAARVGNAELGLGIVATHLSLVDRTRHRQVESLLAHEALNSGPAILMGDMNAWRKCKGSVALDSSLGLHHNFDWPASFPSTRPMLALDRIYTRNAAVVEIEEHDTPAARKASDHLPVVARVALEKTGEAEVDGGSGPIS